MTVLIVSFLLALIFLCRKHAFYMAEKDYTDEIKRMASDISEDDDVIIRGLYEPLRNGLKGEVVIYRVGKKAGDVARPASEVGRSRPFFMEQRAVTQNYSIPKDIYADMKDFTEKLSAYLRTERKARDVLNNLSMMDDMPDKF